MVSSQVKFVEESDFCRAFFFLLVFVFLGGFFERGMEKEKLNEFFELSSHLRKIQMSLAIP